MSLSSISGTGLNMCGLAGFLGYGGLNGEEVRRITKQMGDSLAHRGPDDSGVWCDHNSEIALSHQRLSILDLSSAGHQPMISTSGRFVTVFNGEIYNHLEIRDELQKEEAQPDWLGHSDTETFLAAVEAWGLEDTLRHTVGMFALALWDRKERALYLTRDRMGEKPLYYGLQGGVFLFGSELKALRTHPAFKGEINRDVLALFLRHNYIPEPYSIYRGVKKLPPGFFLKLDGSSSQFTAKELPAPSPYWSLRDTVISGLENPYAGNDSDAIKAMEGLLNTAVRGQMVADVPLGAFLSGGIDSTIVAALMQAQSTRPVSTFTIGFHEAGYNEALHAKAVARHLGTEHTELYVTPEQAQAVIPKLPALYDEPFSDSSQIPTFLVSELTRRHVKVSLSGDGGDELFGGYNRYVLAQKIWSKISRLPESVRSLAESFIFTLSPGSWNKLLEPLQFLAPTSLHQANIGDKLHKGAGVLGAQSTDELYLRLVTHWQPDGLVIGAEEPPTYLRGNRQVFGCLGNIERMMALDTITYLPGDILVKVDRAAMGTSLETRAPLLDHRVVEFAWRLPLSMKIRKGESKWLLRRVLQKYVPKELIERPKMGFSLPIDSWLRGPLRDWAESLLDESRLRQQGFFNTRPILQKWAEHISGQRNWQHHIWGVLMFQAWLELEQAN